MTMNFPLDIALLLVLVPPRPGPAAAGEMAGQ
jgi:hypothetical protein